MQYYFIFYNKHKNTINKNIIMYVNILYNLQSYFNVIIIVKTGKERNFNKYISLLIGSIQIPELQTWL